MITLSEAQKFTQSKFYEGIIDEFRKDKLLDLMVFDDTVTATGSSLSYSYDRVTTLPQANFRALNTEYTPQETAVTQYTVYLKPLGGSFEIDRVLQNNMKGITDQVTFQLTQKIKATKALFSDTFINGDVAVDSNSFDGIDKAVTGSSTDFSPETAIDLSNAAAIKANGSEFMLYLDLVLSELDDTASGIFVNKKMKAVMNFLAKQSGFWSTSDIDQWGRPVTKYSGIPIVELGNKPGTNSPIIGIDSSTRKTSLYVARIGLDGLHAVAPQDQELIQTYLPDFKTANAVKKGEVEMVTAMALKSTKAAGKLGNIVL